MTKKFFIGTAIILFLGLGLNASAGLSAQETVPKDQTDQVIIIPPEVKTVLVQGLETREARTDIPFSMRKHLYLPARENMHSIFILNIKNSDLGFVPVAPAVAVPEKTEEEKPAETAPAEPEKYQATANAFLFFKQVDGVYEKEVYIPIKMQVEADAFDPDEEGMYCTGYPLPPGQYVLALAIASQNLERIGTQYFDFTLPNPMAFADSLDVTPIFFAKAIKRMEAPETSAEVHKGYFTYSVLQIEPNLDMIFYPGDYLDVFFFIFGAQPSPETQRFDVDVNYQVLQEGETVIKYAATKYDSPIVSQPLPMKKTVIVKTTEEGQEPTEKREQRDLDPGPYVLAIDILDNVSGKTHKTKVDFEVKAEEAQ